eukprot:369161-Pyramimonas_sp.AAC.1
MRQGFGNKDSLSHASRSTSRTSRVNAVYYIATKACLFSHSSPKWRRASHETVQLSIAEYSGVLARV